MQPIKLECANWRKDWSVKETRDRERERDVGTVSPRKPSSLITTFNAQRS